MTRGNNRHTVFKSNKDYLYFLELIKRYKQEHPFDLYHYCLMPNHTHFLVKTNKANNFSTFMKKLNLAYFHHYRQDYGWVGHFWQDRYKSQTVGKDEYFIQCGKYIELNPVRKNLVRKPEDYKYSSYRLYAQGVVNDLVTTDFLYDELGKTPKERQKQYRELLVSQIIEDTHKRKNTWGSSEQRYNEQQKINRRFKKAEVSG
jgi:putative transposase